MNWANREELFFRKLEILRVLLLILKRYQLNNIRPVSLMERSLLDGSSTAGNCHDDCTKSVIAGKCEIRKVPTQLNSSRSLVRNYVSCTTLGFSLISGEPARNLLRSPMDDWSK